jgi:hypothetical protein
MIAAQAGMHSTRLRRHCLRQTRCVSEAFGFDLSPEAVRKRGEVKTEGFG